MKTKSIAVKQNSAAIDKILKDHRLDIQVGDIFIDDDGDYFRADKIGFSDRGREGVVVHLSRQYGDEWSGYGQIELDRFERDEYIKVTQPIDQLEAEALAAAADPDKLDPWADQEASSETALVATGNKAQVEMMRTAVSEQMRKVETIARVLAGRVSQMQAIASGMQDKLGVIGKVIGALELYLGTNEDIVCIREGNPAPPATTIQIMQLILYMDEEVGDPREKHGVRGIDFRSVEDFDAWVIQEKNALRLFHGEKGMVAIKPSRQRHQYSDNAFMNVSEEANNQWVYLLIRNGQKLFRIWSNTVMDEKLYPGETELADLFDQAEKKRGYFEKRDAADAQFGYQRNALLLQGLLDRTEVFFPLPHPVNLFKEETYKDIVRFVRDGEPSLGSGRATYKEWKNDINSRIVRGSRVFLSAIDWRYWRNVAGDRLARYYPNDDYPPCPEPGVYEVDQRANGGELFILYNPGDTVWFGPGWTYDSHPRKIRLSFKIKPVDSFVLNYDAMGLDDVEYYIDNRRERRDYLEMIPVLWGIRDARLEEIEWEKGFVKLVSGRQNVPETAVWESVLWWETKNLWKRGLRKDDALALRMIEKRVTRSDGGEEQ